MRIALSGSRVAPSPSRNHLYTFLALIVGLYAGITISSIQSGRHSGDLSGTRGSVRQKDSFELSVDDIDRLKSEIRQSNSEKERWKAELEKLRKDYANKLNQVHNLESEGCSRRENDPFDEETLGQRPAENPNHHPICQNLPFPTPSALALWNRNILDILRATRLPNDAKYKFHDFTVQLLQIITPRLPRSVKTIPHDWTSVERAMTIVWERYQYLQLTPQERASVQKSPRPLKILVMGGSLLVGTNCRKLLSDLNLSFRLPKRDCTWSNRLLQFLNSYAGSDLVEVTKVAMGGTNTATGNVIWQYDLIPEDARNPDVVLNAYSTNDMHILTMLEAQSSNVTLRDKVFNMTQDFVRQILHTCDPNRTPPLLLHVDDYLGNEQRRIWDTTELSQGVQVLANYYGFASFSYADVVREIVYGDTYESWLSANWWEKGSFEREIHPGMGMHIASTWVTVYNLLNLVTTFCSIPPTPLDHDISEYREGLLGLPPLKNDVAQAANKPKSHPKGLPPVLTKDLLLEDVTKLWLNAEQNNGTCDPEKVEGGHRHAKCPFSWVSGLSLQQNNQTWIEEYFQRQATKWEGWMLANDGGKVGFIPRQVSETKGNATDMLLKFEFEQTIRSVTLFFMKSYGDKWEGSKLQFQTWTDEDDSTLDQIRLEERFLEGVHDKNTSEMYTEAISLSEPIKVGKTLKIRARLVGGTMFKIMGLAVCS